MGWGTYDLIRIFARKTTERRDRQQDHSPEAQLPLMRRAGQPVGGHAQHKQVQRQAHEEQVPDAAGQAEVVIRAQTGQGRVFVVQPPLFRDGRRLGLGPCGPGQPPPKGGSALDCMLRIGL